MKNETVYLYDLSGRIILISQSPEINIDDLDKG
jgi:hypothetical protein